jgi:prophage DNA circulation protein
VSKRAAIAASVVQALADIIEATRASLPLAADTAANLATRISRVRAAMVGTVDLTSLANGTGDLCDIIRDLGRRADPALAESRIAAALPQIAAAVPVSASPAITLASDLGHAIAACVEAACLAEVAVAISSRAYTDRRSALAGCARLTAAADASLERIALAAGEDVWRAASDAIRHALDFLSRGALDLKPVVLVESMRSFPATVLAWRLYGDPSRAAELVDRNGVATSLFMPCAIEALAS